MSLQLVANHLAQKGRGPDSTLVHMTPGEVASLQALAQQHGGSLSINPQTGLPEAGFLSALLPMAAGAALTTMGMPAGYAALSVGAASAATNGGDLRKSLMVGISAYGGASMAESFMGAGLGTMGGAMGTSAAEAAPTVLATPAGATSPYALTGSTSAAPSAAKYSLGEPSSFLNQPLPSLVSTAPAQVAQAAAAATPAAQAAQQAAALDSMSMGQRFDALKAGATGTNALNYIKANPFTSLGVATAAMTPDENNTPQKAADTDRGPRAKLQYYSGYGTSLPAPNMQGIEQTYNRPYYAAEGGVTRMATGGITSAPRNQQQLFADYLARVSGSGATTTTPPTNKYEWWKNPNDPAPAAPAAPAETAEEYAARTRVNARGGGGGMSAEQRAEQAADNAKPQPMLNGLSRDQFFKLSPEEQNAVRAQADADNPKTATFLNAVKFVASPGKYLYDAFRGPEPASEMQKYIDAADAESRTLTRDRAFTAAPVQAQFPYGPEEAARDEAARDPANWNDAPISAAEAEASQREVDSLGKSNRAAEFGGQSTGFTDGSYTTSLSLPSYRAGDESQLAGDIKDGTVRLGDSVSFDGKQYTVRESDGAIRLTKGTQEGPAALSLPTSQDAVAQTNAALGYTFQPNAVRDMLANSDLSAPNYGIKDNTVDKYLYANEAQEKEGRTPRLVPTQYEGIVSAADLGSQFPGPVAAPTPDPFVGFNDNNDDRYIAPAPAPAPATDAAAETNAALTPAEVKAFNAFDFGPTAQVAEKNYAGYTRQAAEQKARIENMLGVDPYAKFDQFDFGPTALAAKAEQDAATQAQKDRIRSLAEASASLAPAQALMRTDVDTFGPVNYSAADEADRMFAAPDIVGINEIKAEADPNADNYAQILKAFDQDNTDTARLLSEPGFRLAAGADYTGGIPDGSTLAGYQGGYNPGYATPNMGYGQGRGAFGIGGVWTNREGVPITTRDGSPVMTGAGAEAMQRAVAESNEAANRTYGNAPERRTGRDATAGDGYGGGYGAVAPGYTGGSEAADGGLSTPYGFQHMANGGLSAMATPYDLGSYSDGGRLLKGPGDGVSDSIPATIGKGRPARLADGEFVIPARIVSEIGNGSTEAGARKLYAMMDRIQAGRKKSVGKGKVAVNSRADKYLPA